MPAVRAPDTKRIGALPRARLLAALDTVPQRGIGLISAPSGYGKTTLLRSWAALHASDPLVLVRLNEGDNDPVVLAERLWAAWRAMQAGPRGAGCDDPGTGPGEAQPRMLDQVLAALVEHAKQCRRPHTLALDDVQRVTNPAVFAALTSALEGLPQRCALLLASREDPPLPWLAARSGDRLVELRAADLAFAPSEVRALLAGPFGLRLPDQVVEELAIATGGWPAGVRVAALEIENADDPAEVLRTGLAANRHVARFFDAEVLDHLPADLVDFLETTSVLDTLYPELCEQLTGRSDSADVLRSLATRGLFTERGTDHTGSYAYHPLFREALESRLGEREPGRRRALLGEATTWCQRHRHHGDAVEYACRAQDWDRARSLILAHSGETLASGKVTTIARWVDALPEEVRHSDVGLSLLEAESYLVLFDRGRYRSALRHVQRLLRTLPAETATGAGIGWRFLVANDLLVRGRLESVVAPLEEAVALDERHPTPDATRRSLAVSRASLQSALATALLLAGKVTEAVDFADRMLDAPEDPGALPLVRALGTKALGHAWQGDERTAGSLAEEGLSVLERMAGTEANDPFLVHLAAVWTGCAPSTSYQSLTFVRALARRSGLDSFQALAELAGARFALMGGNLAAAQRAHAAALEHVGALGEPGVFPSLAAAIAAELDQSEPSHDEVSLSEREVAILGELARGATRRQAADALHLSIDTVKTYLRRAYRTLGVDSRDAAVARAVAIGLLPAGSGSDRPAAD